MGLPKINFIGMSNTIEVKDKTGNVQVHISINDLEVEDEKMLQIRDLQQETAAKLEAILNK